MRLRQTAVPLVAAALAAAGCTSNPSTTTGTTTSAAAGGTAAPPANVQQLQQNYETVVNEVLPSVVQINTATGLGSGVVYDDKGDIITNAHVVGAATTFRVSLATGGPQLSGTLVGSYPAGDLAVIKVDDPKAVHPATPRH